MHIVHLCMPCYPKFHWTEHLLLQITQLQCVHMSGNNPQCRCRIPRMDLDLDGYVEETNSGFYSTVVKCAIAALLLF
ncbi:hypothetical protein DPMN_029288 [Dreissena polymorpha]|uniref:Uncharacterized protein n=1 Tax=Dreissena polymorpha TaxID=45954 RepID=A0A9D4LYS7_DREPO|nr:hypothetical protein DPMN_029288 [Dreissena polymorpha]